MLKGQTVIELTDINTGEKEVIKDENMLTNAIQNIFTPLGFLSDSGRENNLYFGTRFLPYYEKLFGGLLLFDGTIPEDVNQIYAPTNVNMVGCGVFGKANNSKGTARGNYNQAESDINVSQKYAKFVYDFSTSQANGVIASVCLTSKEGGYNSYGSENAEIVGNEDRGVTELIPYVKFDYFNGAGNESSYESSHLGLEKLFLFDVDNDAYYLFKISNTKKITIIKKRMWVKSLSMFAKPASKKDVIEEFDLPELENEIGTYLVTYNFDTSDNCLYIFSSKANNISPNNNINLIKIKFSDWSIQQYAIPNATGKTLAFSKREVNTRELFAYNGYIYALGYDNTSNNYYGNYYKIQISNPANVIEIERLSNTRDKEMSFAYEFGGRIYFDCSTYYNDSKKYGMKVLNTETNKILRTENYGNSYNSMQPSNASFGIPVLNHKMLFYFSVYKERQSDVRERFFIPHNYLATINNLSQPVTKTADKTMKVTYIIQEQ